MVFEDGLEKMMPLHFLHALFSGPEVPEPAAIGICGEWKETVKNKYAAYVLFIIAFFAFWNLVDYLYTTLIARGTYLFAAGTDGAIPAAAAIVSGYLLFLRKNSCRDKQERLPGTGRH